MLSQPSENSHYEIMGFLTKFLPFVTSVQKFWSAHALLYALHVMTTTNLLPYQYLIKTTTIYEAK